jgi:hypothetical protein
VAPHLVPSVTYPIDVADWRWLGLCSRLVGLARQANEAFEAAHLDARIVMELDTPGRHLTLRCGEKWMKLTRQMLIARAHITVERSYRLAAYPPEPGDQACLEELLFELVAASGQAAFA